MRIIKVGGAVLRQESGFDAMEALLSAPNGSSRTILIVSAFDKTTRHLETIAATAEKGDLDAAIAAAHKLYTHHETIAKNIVDTRTFEHIEGELGEVFGTLRNLIKGIAFTGEATPRSLDAVLALGERWALVITKAFLLSKGHSPRICDAAGWLVTDARHGQAQPLEPPTARRIAERLMPVFEETNLIITQGFVGHTEEGIVTTMGKETSNLTAVLLAALTRTSQVEIVSDVSGVCTTDPRLLEAVRPVPFLSYDEAAQAAYGGVKLLFPRMLYLAQKHSITIRVYSAFSPEENGTVISTTAAHSEQSFVLAVIDTISKVSSSFSQDALPALPDNKPVFSCVSNTSSAFFLAAHDSNAGRNTLIGEKSEQLSLITAIACSTPEILEVLSQEALRTKIVSVATGVLHHQHFIVVAAKDLSVTVREIHNHISRSRGILP